MKEKLEKMIETDFQLQKLFMTENPEPIEVFGPETGKPDEPSRKKSASASSRSSASASSHDEPASVEGSEFFLLPVTEKNGHENFFVPEKKFLLSFCWKMARFSSHHDLIVSLLVK